MNFQDTPISDLNAREVARELQGSWVQFRRMLGMSESLLPNEFATGVEVGELMKMFQQFGHLTPRQFEAAMKSAMDSEMHRISNNPEDGFPRMNPPDIKRQLHVVSSAVRAQRPASPALPEAKPSPMAPETVLDELLPQAWHNYSLFEIKGVMPTLWDNEAYPEAWEMLKSRMRAWPDFHDQLGIVLQATHNNFAKRLQQAQAGVGHDFRAPEGERWEGMKMAEWLGGIISQHNEGNARPFRFDAVAEFRAAAGLATLVQYCLITFGKPEADKPESERIGIGSRLRQSLEAPTEVKEPTKPVPKNMKIITNLEDL